MRQVIVATTEDEMHRLAYSTERIAGNRLRAIQASRIGDATTRWQIRNACGNLSPCVGAGKLVTLANGIERLYQYWFGSRRNICAVVGNTGICESVSSSSVFGKRVRCP